MPPQRDREFALKYGIPVEVVRAELSRHVWFARDDEVVQGRYLRVATSDGLINALEVLVEATTSTPPPPPAAAASTVLPTSSASTSALPPPPPPPPPANLLRVDRYAASCSSPTTSLLRVYLNATAVICSGTPAPRLLCYVYVVPYLPPTEAAKIRQMISDTHFPPFSFSIVKKSELEAKESFLMRINAEIFSMEDLQTKLQQILAQYKKVTDGDIGLEVGSNISNLKIRLMLANIAEGKFENAKQILKEVNNLQYQFSYPDGSARGSPQEEKEKILEATSEYVSLHPDPDAVEESAETVAKQLLGVVSTVDFYDRKRLINDEAGLLQQLQDAILDLGKKVSEYENIAAEPSLMGASP